MIASSSPSHLARQLDLLQAPFFPIFFPHPQRPPLLLHIHPFLILSQRSPLLLHMHISLVTLSQPTSSVTRYTPPNCSTKRPFDISPITQNLLCCIQYVNAQRTLCQRSGASQAAIKSPNAASMKFQILDGCDILYYPI